MAEEYKVDRHEAIHSLVGGSIKMSGDKVFYLDGQTPPSDAEIDAEIKRLEDEYEANEYQRSRALEYPSIVDQLDEIYHNGINAWKAVIKKTKDKYPKG
jgi:hypothetical protein